MSMGRRPWDLPDGIQRSTNSGPFCGAVRAWKAAPDVLELGRFGIDPSIEHYLSIQKLAYHAFERDNILFCNLDDSVDV